MIQLLVAVDEHDHAKQIVDCAVVFAKSMSAKILLVYVIPEKSVPEKYSDTHGDSLPEHYYEDVFERTVGGYTKSLENAKLEFEGIYGVGNPTDFILRTAKSRKVNFIVVGIRGLRRIGRLKALGDVARNVIERSEIPVIAVP
jgi:nucleotide-binding universal stress UspA family protein